MILLMLDILNIAKRTGEFSKARICVGVSRSE